MEPKEKDTPAGVGSGITGASGEVIEGTGAGQGVGGTGHDNDRDAAGMRPQDQYTARPDQQQSPTDDQVRTRRLRDSAAAPLAALVAADRMASRRLPGPSRGLRAAGAAARLAMCPVVSVTCRRRTTTPPIPITSTMARARTDRSEPTTSARGIQGRTTSTETGRKAEGLRAFLAP